MGDALAEALLLSWCELAQSNGMPLSDLRPYADATVNRIRESAKRMGFKVSDSEIARFLDLKAV